MMDKNVRIEVWDEETQANIKGWTTRETRDFHENKFVVLRNFIPKDIINMTLDTWKTIEANPDYKDAFFHREEETTNNSPKSSLGKSEGCYKFPPAVALHRWLRDNLRDVIDMELVETYSYTRTYDRGAYLKSHTDRPSCEVSATICLDYKSDDNTPWKIWVQNDRNYIDDAVQDQQQLFDFFQKPVIGKRKGSVAVSLEVGDVLLYQGPNIPHWRDTFLGDYSSHMFLHFVNANSNMNGLDIFKKHTHAHNDRSARSAFVYDGCANRYSTDQSDKYFIRASDAWSNWNNRRHIDPSLPPASELINNYSNIKTPEEKKKK